MWISLTRSGFTYFNKLKQSQQICRRHFHNNYVFSKRAYEGDGKTTLNILNMEHEYGLMISGYSQVGFRLNNDITILGPMVIFPRSVLSWNVKDINDVNDDALSLFSILEPKLDIIVVGVGDRQKNNSFQQKILPFMREHKINFEILPTDVACSTYNFLSSEGRHVAGAMIPPEHLRVHEDDIIKTKLKYQNLYETEWNG